MIVSEAASPDKQPGSPARKSGVVVPRKLKWRHHIAAFLIAIGIRAVACTWRCRFIDSTGIFEPPTEAMIFSLWHNRLALSVVMWRRWAVRKYPAPGVVALISASHDGGVLSRALKYFGMEAVRGSSSRRGAQALLELTSWTERGYHVAITPDGPRGPRYVIHDGVVALAQITGLPIMPISTLVSKKVTIKSWDRFQIPLPFARCDIHFGERLYVPRELADAQREEVKRELERRMMALTKD